MNRILLFGACLLSSASTSAPTQHRDRYTEEFLSVVDVGSQRQLFVDDTIVMEMTRLVRVFHRPEKLPENPILRPTEPGEDNLMVPSRVFFDPRLERFRMWYACGRTDETQSIAYAESGDGIHWERRTSTPDGKVFGDIKPFNRVWIKDPNQPHSAGFRCRDPGLILFDPGETNPARRYKMIMRRGLPLAFSPDGYVWTADPKMVPSYRGSKDENSFSYDPYRRRWLGFLRQNPPRRGQTYLRRILIDESQDLVNWMPTSGELVPDLLDGVGLSFFNCNAFPYAYFFVGLPGTYITAEYHEKDRRDTIDVEVAFSRDGVHWDRPQRGPFISRGEPGSWESSMVGPAVMVAHDEEILFYYMGTAKQHRDDDTGMAYQIGVARLRRDGFVSVESSDPGGSGGLLLTRLLTLTGRRLYLNADVTDGQLRVEVLRHGYGVDPLLPDIDRPWLHEAELSDPVEGDSLRHEVSWKGDVDLARFSGKPVRLRFHLAGEAKLYAFQFLDLGARESAGKD